MPRIYTQALWKKQHEWRMQFAKTILSNHPFVDGNKRVAVTVMLVILRMNDISLSYTQAELIELGLGMADGTIDYENILAWVDVHTIK